MSSTFEVVASGSSVIKFPNFSGQNVGNIYRAEATPDRVSEDSFIFGTETVVVFEFARLTTTADVQNGYRAFDGEVSGNSRLMKITVYENASQYAEGIAAYTYQPQNSDGTNLSNSSDRYGDTYLGVQTNAFASSNKPPIALNGYSGKIPTLGPEIMIMPSVDFYEQLIIKKESFSYTNVQSVDYNQNGIIDANSAEVGNGFFDAGHGNDFAITQQIRPPICFAKGTLIDVEGGAVPVETLKIGDLVQTLDHGLQPIRWIGFTRYSGDLAPQVAPIIVKAGAFGPNIPARDLLVSPQHKLMLRSKIVERMVGESEALVPVKHLVDGIQIYPEVTRDGIEYYHLLLDEHEIIWANGLLAESFFPGPQALELISDVHLATIRALCAARPEKPYRLARQVMGKAQAARLLWRHRKNGTMLMNDVLTEAAA